MTKLRKTGPVDQLFSGQVRPRKPSRHSSRRKKPTEALPADLAPLADVFVAGRKIEKEIEFKIRFAEHQIKDFCLRRFAELFATTGRRPPSIDYEGSQSRFTFIQTGRINLTYEKSEALRAMGLPMEQWTELKGLRVNTAALARHELEGRLREALEAMRLPEETLEECFEPVLQLKETFFDSLVNWLTRARPGEKNPARFTYEVLRVLQPASQVRNADAPGLDADECFKLIRRAEISPDAAEELDAA